MSAQGLRRLAQQYADGLLNRSSYRAARAELLQSLVDASDPPSITEANYTSAKAVPGEETITAATFRRDQTTMLDAQQSREHLHNQTQPIRLTEPARWSRLIPLAAATLLGLAALAYLLLADDADDRPVRPAVDGGPSELQPLSDSP